MCDDTMAEGRVLALHHADTAFEGVCHNYLLIVSLRMQEDAVISAGPPCGSWVFINRFTSGRSVAAPFGLASLRRYVRVANVRLCRILSDTLDFT